MSATPFLISSMSEALGPQPAIIASASVAAPVRIAILPISSPPWRPVRAAVRHYTREQLIDGDRRGIKLPPPRSSFRPFERAQQLGPCALDVRERLVAQSP